MRPPAFQFYVDNFIEGTCDMSNAEVGCYMRLLCKQWSIGGLPDDDRELARIARGVTKSQLSRVKRKFSKTSLGLLVNERLERERAKQIEYRSKQAENGRLGGRPANPSLTQAFSENNPTANPNKSSPSPSPSTKVGKKVQDALDIPKELHSPTFTTAWQKWMTFRRGLGKKPGDWGAMFGEQLVWLKQFGAAEAVEILNQSIRSGWQGLFERKHGNNKTHQPNNSQRIDRNAGNLNSTRTGQYDSVGKVPEVRPP